MKNHMFEIKYEIFIIYLRILNKKKCVLILIISISNTIVQV